ncbi:MAG: hypothetical protein KMY55_14675 [Dethiosulfatibacter sp.]|nr:hypothetical protein [Dethiosulfatibacter sp.]
MNYKRDSKEDINYKMLIMNYEDKIQEVRDEINKIDQLQVEEKYKNIILMCMLDSYAQLNVFLDKKNTNRDKFTSFIKEFSPDGIQKLWDRISLPNSYYFIKDKNNNSCVFKELEKLVKNNNFWNCNDIIELLNNNDYKRIEQTLMGMNSFTFANLFYTARNKLLHEFKLMNNEQGVLNTDFACFITVLNIDYSCIEQRREKVNKILTSKLDENDQDDRIINNCVKDKTLECKECYRTVSLVFPYRFIRNVTGECIIQYLEKCKKEKKQIYKNSIEYIHWKEELLI